MPASSSRTPTMTTRRMYNTSFSSFNQSKTPSPLSRLRESYSRREHMSSDYWQQRINGSPAQTERKTVPMSSSSGLLRTLLLQEDDDTERLTKYLKRDLRELADDELLNDLTTAILRCRIRRLKRNQLNSNEPPPNPTLSVSSISNVNESAKKSKTRSSQVNTTIPMSSATDNTSGNISDGDCKSSTSTTSSSSESASAPSQQRVQFLQEARERRLRENDLPQKSNPEVPSVLVEKCRDMSLQEGGTNQETIKKRKEQDEQEKQTNETTARMEHVHISSTVEPQFQSNKSTNAKVENDSNKEKDADIVVSNLLKEFDLSQKSSVEDSDDKKNKDLHINTSDVDKNNAAKEEDPNFIPTPPSPDFSISALFSPDASGVPTSKASCTSEEKIEKDTEEENTFITPRFMEHNSFTFPTDEKTVQPSQGQSANFHNACSSDEKGTNSNENKENDNETMTTTGTSGGITIPDISKLKFVIGSNGNKKKTSTFQQRRNNRHNKAPTQDASITGCAPFAPQPAPTINAKTTASVSPSVQLQNQIPRTHTGRKIRSDVKKKEVNPFHEAGTLYSQSPLREGDKNDGGDDVDMMDITMEECSPLPQQHPSTPSLDSSSRFQNTDNKSSSNQNVRSDKKKETPNNSWNHISSNTKKTDEFLSAAIAQGIRFSVGKSGKVVPNITPPRNRGIESTESRRKTKNFDTTTSTAKTGNIGNIHVNNKTSFTEKKSKMSTDELLAAAAARAAESAGQTEASGFSVDIGKSTGGKKKVSPRHGSSRVTRFGSGSRNRGPPAPDNNLRSPGADTGLGMVTKSTSSRQPITRNLFSSSTATNSADSGNPTDSTQSDQEPTRSSSLLFESKDALQSMYEKYNSCESSEKFGGGENGLENTKANEAKMIAEQQEIARKKAKYEQIITLRDIGRSLYIDGKYRESVIKYTASIAACTDNFSSKPEDIDDVDLLATLYGNRAAGLMMIGSYNASASDCTKALNYLSGFKQTLSSQEIIDLATQNMRPDGGVTLATKLLARKGRSCLKAGHCKLAEEAFDQSIRIGRLGLLAQQRARDAKLQNGDDSSPSETNQLAEKSLNQTITESTINKTEVIRLKEFMKSIQSLGGVSINPNTAALKRNNLQLFHLLNSAAALASGDSSLQESRITCLASMKRWTEVASYCERLACDNVKADGVWTGDLKDLDPFPGIEQAKYLKWNTFETEDRNSSPSQTLNSKEAAEAIVRIPESISKTYIRALRLEERYSEATKAVNALLKNIKMHNRSEKFDWLEVEGDKIRKTMTGKDRGDSLYNRGEYKQAAMKYATVLSIDSDDDNNHQKKDPWDLITSGGRLHAVLHCNRAACLMALKQYREASKECTAALRIQNQYMKAILRRARCYARMEHFEESIAEYNRWIQLVDDAKKNGKGGGNHLNSCPFDRACDITNAEKKKATEELLDVKNSHKKNEVEAETRASRKNWQSSNDFRKSAPDIWGTQSTHAKQRRFNSFSASGQNAADSHAYTKQQQWNSQKNDQSRRWDSFNGSGPKKNGQHGSNTNNNSNYQRSSSSGRFNSNKSGSNRYQSASDGEASPTKKDCHYKVLDVTKNATAVQIKKAYHKLALKYHPDKNQSASSADNFRKIQQAYEILSNETSRRKYNAEMRFQQGTSYYY